MVKENAKLVILERGEMARFSFLAWKQIEMEVRFKCECGHIGIAHHLTCQGPQQFDLVEDCWFCGIPMLGEIIFA